jgi:hypothetical protein
VKFATIPLTAVLVGGIACAPYKVIERSGPPSALAKADEVVVTFDYSQLRLGMLAQKTEEEFQAGKDTEKFDDVKEKMDLELGQAFAESIDGKVVADAPAKMTVFYTMMQQGKFAPPFVQDTVIKAQCVFSDGDTVTDKIETTAQVPASVTQPSIYQRAGVAARMLGKRCAHYYNKSRKA